MKYQHKISMILALLFILLLVLSACNRSSSSADMDEENSVGDEENTAPTDTTEDPVAPVPQATNIFPEPVRQPIVVADAAEDISDDETETVEGAETDTTQQPVTSSAASSAETESSESATVQEIIEETEALVETSRRLLPDFNPDVTVHFIDVGLGDATLVQTASGKNVLVDCGDYTMGRRIVNYLRQENVEQLDALVVSSPRNEHVGGCDYVIQYFPPGQIYDTGMDSELRPFKLFMATIEDSDLNYVSLHEPVTFDLDDTTTASVLTPYHGRTRGNVKDNSLVFKLDHGDVHFLIAGDCSKGCERELREYYPPEELQTTIFRVGDHGSDDVATELFLDVALPDVAVLSTVNDPTSNLPSLSTLRRLQKYDAKIYRTDYDGDVIVRTDGRGYVIDVRKGIQHIDLSGQQNYTVSPYSECPFVAHLYSNVYYPLDCAYTPNIEPENRLCLTSEKQAFDLGLVKYTKCN